MSVPRVNGAPITINWVADHPHHAYRMLKASGQYVKELEADLEKLICLDVTTREGQAAFAEWRNEYERKSTP